MWGHAKASGAGEDRAERTDEEMFRVYTSIWQNIAREDGNVSNRIGWANALTAGQFTAIAFLVTRAIAVEGAPEVPAAIAATVCAVSVLGMYFCYRTHLGVEAAHQQMEMLRRCYANSEKRFSSMMLPRPFGDGNNRAGRKSSNVYPMALLTFWSLIFVISLGGTIWSLSRVAITQDIAQRQQEEARTRQTIARAEQDRLEHELTEARTRLTELQRRLDDAQRPQVNRSTVSSRPVPRPGARRLHGRRA